MNRDGVWAAIDAQRERLAALLDDLSEDEWRQPSLCDGWTVRDVAAHLTLQQLGWGEALAGMARHRFDAQRAIQGSTRERAAWQTAEIIAAIRGMVGSRRHNAGVTYRETLIDILVHSQDIALPLGRDLPVAQDAAAVALSRMWTMRWPPPFPATARLKRFRVVATDVDWSAGGGPEVRGPVGAILLVASGRPVALPRLTGADLG